MLNSARSALDVQSASAKKCQKVQEACTNRLLKQQGINGTAVGEKWVNGKPTGQEAILVFVQKKFSAKAIVNPNVLTKFTADDLIPEQIDGIPTDVIEVGRIVKQAGFKGKVRPIKPGYSVGHGKITAGTIGGIFNDRDGDPVILSNNHVIANENNAKIGDLIYQPGPIDSNQSHQDIGWQKPVAGLPYIGTLKKFMRLKGTGNLHDSAIAKIHQQVVNSDLVDDTYPQINSRLTGFGNPVVGMPVQKCGRTTGYTTGRVLGVNASFTIEYDFGNARFDKCIVLTAMSKGGDSGSIIQDMNERAVALLFAGSAKVTIASPIDVVRDYYGLSLYTDSPNREEETIKLNDGKWVVRGAGTNKVTVKDGIIKIAAAANNSACVERPISKLKLVRCTVNTGTDKGATWGTGLSVHWPNGYIKLNLRHNGAFGGYVNGSYNINVGKVQAERDYGLRIRDAGGTYVGEIKDGGGWFKIVEVPKRLFPNQPTMVRLGKTDLNANAANHHIPGAVGESAIKDFIHS